MKCILNFFEEEDVDSAARFSSQEVSMSTMGGEGLPSVSHPTGTSCSSLSSEGGEGSPFLGLSQGWGSLRSLGCKVYLLSVLKVYL